MVGEGNTELMHLIPESPQTPPNEHLAPGRKPAVKGTRNATGTNRIQPIFTRHFWSSCVLNLGRKVDKRENL